MQIEEVNGMKTIYLDHNDCLTDEEAEKKVGKWLDNDDAKMILKESADVYGPPDIYGNREPLIMFRKGYFTRELTRAAYESLKSAATETENRGVAAGPREPGSHRNREWYVDPVTGKMDGRTIVKSTGKVSNTRYANIVNSGTAGYLDRYVRIPYCRQTAWTKSNREKFEGAIPFIQQISRGFERYLPDRFANQKSVVDRTPKDFVIDGSVYTTVTVNKNFRTAAHRDAGDLKDGFGNLTVVSNDIDYDGGYTIMPKFQVGVDVREGDLLLFDVHQIHGNTALEGDEGFERVSFVCYYREGMQHCSHARYEQARYDFINERRLNPEHPGHEQTKETGGRWNGISPGMWESDEWFDYLMRQGMEEDARKDFPKKFMKGKEGLDEFFS